jgi:hypothetical protein
MAFFLEPTKNMTDAYHTDGTDKWFGKAPKGCKVTDSQWLIFKMEYTGGGDWIIKYPVDPVTNKGSDSPKFVWGASGATAVGYAYALLGCEA